jgi:negative regulator of flagellin synthesis FlgM
MKIESNSANPLAIRQTGSTRAASGIEAQSAIGSVGGVQQASSTVNLSSMSELRSASGSDIDVAKVASIKAALRDGTYKISSGNIADGMISSARDMLQTKRG